MKLLTGAEVLSIFSILLMFVQCEHYWTYTCNQSRCSKRRLQPGEPPASLERCELQCFDLSGIWPMPNGKYMLKNAMIPVQISNNGSAHSSKLLNKMVNRFFLLLDTYNDYPTTKCRDCIEIKLNINIGDSRTTVLDLYTDESYKLSFDLRLSDIVNIEAATIFGARHALETLSQLIVFDTVDKMYIMQENVLMWDQPTYPVRGLLVDTARNYLSVPTIRSIIEGMAVNKLNTLHWHITDSQSFPFVSASLPELSGLGAYSPKKVYTAETIQDLISWAKVRGVRIIPEFDAPAHVGEGWQDSGLVVCFNQQPWQSFCKEPPCGQFDPTNDKLYSTLRKLYRDLIAAFEPVAFHFGGDEVTFNCWRSVESIRNWMTARNMSWTFDSGHVELWSTFQNGSYNIFMEEARRTIPAIIWTSTLTDAAHLHNLPNDKYIIHVWTAKSDRTIKNLLEKDYKIILSNYDALYLDCGFHNWIGANTNNWCSPYITWMKVYENSPRKIVQSFGATTVNKTDLIVGSIAALWTETIDDSSVENRIWPRASALAERLWAEPHDNWRYAENRLNKHRERMVKLGINADTLAPEWCRANQGNCS